MNARPYPPGHAFAIATARSNGLQPADVVLVVLAGRFSWPNPTVYADPARRYRWDWLRGLSAVVLINAQTRLGETLHDIEAVGPRQVDVIDFERRHGWLVNSTSPRLTTVRWPQAWVDSWLGDGQALADLHEIKAAAAADDAINKALKARTERELDEVEITWN